MEEIEIVLEQESNSEIEIELINEGTILYPELEDLEITPKGEELNFKSSKYGYDNVKVKAVNLQDKKMTLNENGIYNIKADEEYSGLNNVEITLNAIEDLDTELTEQDNLLTTQEDTIEEIVKALQNKGAGVRDYLPYVTTTPLLTDASFPEDLRDVVLKLPLLTTYGSFRCFSGTNATSLIVIGENITSFNFSYAFYNSQSLKYVDFSKCNDGTLLLEHIGNAFQMCPSLESVIGNLDFSKTAGSQNCFMACNSLKEFRVVPLSIKGNFQVNQSPNLSNETIQSIIDGLADLTGSTAQTLTLHKDVKAKLTETQIASITSKNWTLA